MEAERRNSLGIRGDGTWEFSSPSMIQKRDDSGQSSRFSWWEDRGTAARNIVGTINKGGGALGTAEKGEKKAQRKRQWKGKVPD